MPIYIRPQDPTGAAGRLSKGDRLSKGFKRTNILATRVT